MESLTLITHKTILTVGDLKMTRIKLIKVKRHLIESLILDVEEHILTMGILLESMFFHRNLNNCIYRWILTAAHCIESLGSEGFQVAYCII